MKDFAELQKLDETGFKMPVLFVGHGSPMNAIEENSFTEGWRKSVENLPKPKAVLVVSAHWETIGTKITAQAKPRTIHDFYGFPQTLFDVQYPASGNAELAKDTAEKLKERLLELDETWGFDHGSWSVLKHLYPNADVPVLQLSLNRLQTPREHFELAKDLKFLRQKGVLIIGSGNIVHNLRVLNFRQIGGFDWADKASEKFKKLILSDNFEPLINYETLGREASLAIPTPEHFLPLLYTLALKDNDENIEIFNDKVELGSISMTSLKIGS